MQTHEHPLLWLETVDGVEGLCPSCGAVVRPEVRRGWGWRGALAVLGLTGGFWIGLAVLVRWALR